MWSVAIAKLLQSHRIAITHIMRLQRNSMARGRLFEFNTRFCIVYQMLHRISIVATLTHSESQKICCRRRCCVVVSSSMNWNELMMAVTHLQCVRTARRWLKFNISVSPFFIFSCFFFFRFFIFWPFFFGEDRKRIALCIYIYMCVCVVEFCPRCVRYKTKTAKFITINRKMKKILVNKSTVNDNIYIYI